MPLVWFVLWMVHGHPWLLSAWGPWNISLLVTAFFDNLGTTRWRTRVVYRKA